MTPILKWRPRSTVKRFDQFLCSVVHVVVVVVVVVVFVVVVVVVVVVVIVVVIFVVVVVVFIMFVAFVVVIVLLLFCCCLGGVFVSVVYSFLLKKKKTIKVSVFFSCKQSLESPKRTSLSLYEFFFFCVHRDFRFAYGSISLKPSSIFWKPNLTHENVYRNAPNVYSTCVQ